MLTIELSWTPINAKLPLAFSIAQPMESHVHCRGACWLYLAIGDGFRHSIVGLQWCWRLFMPHLF